MNVSVLCTSHSINFVHQLFSNMGKVKVVPLILDENTPVNLVQKELDISDVIVTIIDKKFKLYSELDMSLQYALYVTRRNKNKIIFPIILDNVFPPISLRMMQNSVCKSENESDIIIVAQRLEKTLIKRNNIKGTSNRYNSRMNIVIITIAIEIFAMFIYFILNYKYSTHYNLTNTIFNENTSRVFIEVMAFIFAITVLLTSYLLVIKRQRQEDEEEEIDSYSRRLKKAMVVEEIKSENQNDSVSTDIKAIDALGRMMINLEDIKEFYTWSQKQAKASFVLAVIMCILGFALMVLAIVLPIFFDLSLGASLIPAVGGVITELIACTALVVYRNSLSQLNHYHKALHEDERFLSSVNLLARFSTKELQDEMLKEIIKSEIKMNLLGIDEITKSSFDKLKNSK